MMGLGTPVTNPATGHIEGWFLHGQEIVAECGGHWYPANPPMGDPAGAGT